MARTPKSPEDHAEEGTLRRLGGDRGPSLSEALAGRIAAGLYQSPLHKLRLKGRFPLKLLGVPADPVPGDPHIGERLAAGRLIHAGHTAMTRDITFREPGHPAAWTDWAMSWAWLRDLAAHLPEPKAGAAVAEPLVARWLASFAEYDALAWRPDLAGRRLLFGFAHAPLILSSSDQVYRSAVLAAMATWARHLDRAAPRLPDGLAKAWALAGLYAAGVLIPGGEVRERTALAGLDALLAQIVLPDGGIITRAPVDALAVAELLLMAAAAPEALGRRAPPLFADVLARLVPALRGLALGDGMVGAWNGAAVIAPAALERLARQTATGTALTRSGRWSGYYRLSAGKTVLVVDAGPPPAPRIAAGGHAGTLAFEMSDGPDRLVTNCGGERGLPAPLPGALASGLRTTAAHSTLVIADTNSTRLRDDGLLGNGVTEVAVNLRTSEGSHWFDAAHDGYVRRFGMLVRRRLFLSADGQDLRGEDVIEAVPSKLMLRRQDRAFAIRFHLGPGVSATPTADGAGALLKLPQGRVWAFKARFAAGGGSVAIEPSLWVDGAGTLQKSLQLVVNGRTERMLADIGWSFKRAGK